MALTQLQKLELNKRVDHIIHAPSNMPARGQQLEMAFVLDLSTDQEYLHSALKDAAAALKAHDQIFQNVRNNVVYWSDERIVTKVMPMSFIQIGKIFEDIHVDKVDMIVDNRPRLELLCGYLKFYHARSKCILVFTDCAADQLSIQDYDKAIETLNPFLKYRIVVITPERMISGSELLKKLSDAKMVKDAAGKTSKFTG